MFSRKKSDPIKIFCEIEIEASCNEVYTALNLHNPNNRYLKRGFSLFPDADADAPGAFVMKMPNLPHLSFFLSEQLAVPAAQYDISCRFPPGQPVGVLTGDDSEYSLSPMPNGGCHLASHVTFHTIPLSKKARDEEMISLLFAVNDDLARLKALLEESPEAAEKAGALDAIFDALEGVS